MEKVVEIIAKLIKEKNIMEKTFLSDLGLNRCLMSDWKSGKSVSYMKHINKIADYFNVSVDYMLGKSEQKKMPLTMDGVELADYEEELIMFYRSLADEGKKMLLRAAGIDPDNLEL